MRRTRKRTIPLTLPLLYLLAVPLFSQPAKTSREFVIDASRPFVYVKFDHIGPGIPRTGDEPATRIWLRFVNNCRVPVVVRANGVPDQSPKEEVGLEYDVVGNRPTYPMVSFSMRVDTRPRLPTKIEPATKAVPKESEQDTPQIPQGYMEEVSSTAVIDSGEEILFSMPVNHLSKRWHVEIPFEFEVPRGKGPHDDRTGGIPIMVVEYTLYDLPPNSQAEIPTE